MMHSLITMAQARVLCGSSIAQTETYELFQRAAETRLSAIGSIPWLTSGSGGVFPCFVQPRCGYCSFYSEEMFPADALCRYVEKLTALGYRQFHISGGTDLSGGFAEPLLTLLRKLKTCTGIQIEVNLGPSFSEDAVLEMKSLGVESITSSLECTNPKVFAQAKPGDSLEKRIDLLRICERNGIPCRSMMLIGLGETMEDRIQQLFFLSQFSSLYQLRISRFQPFAGTAYAQNPRCTPWEVAQITALARLILPDREICLAAGNTDDDIPLWYLAGGGNQVMGAFVTSREPKAGSGTDVYKMGDRAYVIDRQQEKRRLFDKMGVDDVGFAPQLRKEATHYVP